MRFPTRVEFPIIEYPWRWIALSLMALMSTALAAPATAQTGGEDLGERQVQDEIEEIVVTATRREERLVDVPAPVTVIVPDQLQSSGAKDLGDYLFAQPGVNYNKTGTPGRGEVTMRGVSTGQLTTPVVGVYVDDVPIGSALAFADGEEAFDQRLLDLDRIEVLRGPQGTLFGVSALGGALRYITEDATLDGFSGTAFADLSVTKEGGFNTTVSSAVNLPAGENVALRVSGFYTRDGGYVDAIGPEGGEDVNDGDVYGGRLSLLLAPTDRFEVRLNAQIQKTEYDGLSFVDVDPETLAPTIGDLTAGNLLFDETQDFETQLYSLNLNYHLGFADLISITAYQDKSILRRQDFSDTGIFFGAFFEPFFPPVIATVDNRFSEVQKWTQEIRLVSDNDGPIQWQGGVFFTTEDGRLAQNLVQTYEGGIVANGTNFPLFFGPDSGFETDYQEIAGYLTVDWAVTDYLTLTGGVRVARNEIDVLQLNDGFFAGVPNNGSSTDETPVTFLFTARYAATDESNIYARVASGYRAGGPNVGLVDPTSPTGVAQSPPTYESDTLINYELGYKGASFDGRLTIDGSLYWIEWSDIQQSISTGNFTAFTGNAGEARIRGAELGVIALPTDIVSVGGTLSYINAEVTEVSPIATVAVSDGDRLPGSAEWQGTLFVQLDGNLGQYPAFVRAEQTFLGDRLSAFVASGTAIRLPDFETTDFSAGISFDRFDLGIYVRNITDERGVLGALPPDVPGLFPANATYVRPRTIGATVSVEF